MVARAPLSFFPGVRIRHCLQVPGAGVMWPSLRRTNLGRG